MSEDFIVAQTGDVLEITINHPERGNAMSDPMIVELGDLIEREHEKVRLFVLRGAGDDFCAGRSPIGRKPMPSEAYDVRDASDHVFRCYGLLRRSKAPVLAVVKGRAEGFGYALAAAADITIAADTAKFTIPEFSHNIMPTMVMSAMIDRVPLKALMYNVWTSQYITAEKAMAIGSVSHVVPEADLEAHVTALVERLVAAPKPALFAVKEYGVTSQPIDIDKAQHFARSLHAMVNSSSQMKRGQK
jgi:enoyl-CoA hydratase